MNEFSSDIEARFEAAVALHNAGQFQQAKDHYESVIVAAPSHAEAMHNLGILFVQNNQFADAAIWIGRAVEVNPLEPTYLSNYGNVLQDLKRYDEAISQYQKATELSPHYVEAHFNLGNAFQKNGQHQLAVDSYKRAISLNPKWAEAYLNCGNSCDALGQHVEALWNFDKAIECNSSFSGGYINRSAVLNKLGRHAEALAGYSQVIAMGREVYQAYLGRAEIYLNQLEFHQAIESCKLAIKAKPAEANPYCLMGMAYFRMHDINHAVAYYQRAIELRPDYDDAHVGIGVAYMKAGCFPEAQESFRRALAINPAMLIARVNLADSFFTQGDLRSALENFRLLPAEFQPLGLMQFLKLQLGDWSNYEEDREVFLAQIRKPRLMGLTEDPWHLQRISDSPALAKEVAQNFIHSALLIRGVHERSSIEKKKKRKIKVGYFSPDFREHAVSYLALELFESHSRNQFETYAFSFGICNKDDAMRPKLEKAFDHFININPRNDEDAVKLVRELGIDIAVDLAGITSEARMMIFAQRAAPVQVNYLGFTATLGTGFHDYIIADPIVIPDCMREYYTEKVVQLPCVMPYDTKRNVITSNPPRASLGLPATGFIFCSFNQCFKITPDVLRSWMRILSRVPTSYLWFSSQRPAAVEGLKNEARKAGIDPERLIFAPRIKEATDHLARLQAGDLFLDTFPYNAHTSAIDSLWAGVPIVTRMGDSFASRVAGSLLTALDLRELIVNDIGQYEDLAVELANHPEKMKAIKKKLLENKATMSLFNMRQYRENFEKALVKMYERYQADLPPDHFKID